MLHKDSTHHIVISNGINKPLKEFSYRYIRENVKAVTLDMDGVTIPAGTFLRENIAGTELVMKTHTLSPGMVKMIKRLKQHVWVNFSSGRALLYLQHILGDILWENVSLTAENGNFILMNGKIRQLAAYDLDYFQKITDIREDLKKLKARKPREVLGFEPKHVIVTVHTTHEMPEVAEIVKKHDRERELYCLWTSEGYDIGHQKTNKVTALRFLCNALKVKPAQMVTSGNNLNDREMLDFGTGVSVDPHMVSAKYAIPKKRNVLGGEVLAAHLLRAYEGRS